MAFTGMRETHADLMDRLHPDHKIEKIARNTYKRVETDGTIVYRLHRTDIVTVGPNGRVTLNSGGWLSPVTKDRMNMVLDMHTLKSGSRASVYSDKGQWIVNGVPYFDGMEIRSDGTIPGATKSKGEAEGKRRRALANKIAKFVLLVPKYGHGDVPMPGAGDCFLCMAEAPDQTPRVKIGHLDRTGEKSPNGMNKGHILEHVGEGYLHGSLLRNAMAWAGFGPGALDYYAAHCRDSGRKVIRNALRRYLRHRLGLAL